MSTATLTVSKNRQIASLVLNLAIVIIEIIGIGLSIQTHGVLLLKYYTEDSNILALFSCSIFAIYSIRCLKSGTYSMPKWVIIAKYIATACLTVTFVVVLCVLIPMENSGGFKVIMFSGSMLYHHFLCPVTAIISFIFVDATLPLTRKHTFFALIPTILYAIVSVILNVTKIMEGPYPFLKVYEQPLYMSIIWVFVILGIAYLFAWLIRLVSGKVLEKNLHKSLPN